MTDDFSETLRAWRRTHGLRQKEAAAMFNVSLRTVQGWEYGVIKPARTCEKCLREIMTQKDSK